MTSSYIAESDPKLELDNDIGHENRGEPSNADMLVGGKNIEKEVRVELSKTNVSDDGEDAQKVDRGKPSDVQILNIHKDYPKSDNEHGQDELDENMDEKIDLRSISQEEENQTSMEILGEEKEPEPVFDGTEIPGLEVSRSTSSHSLDLNSENQGNAWPEKAIAIKNYVRQKSAVAVSTVLRTLSVKKHEIEVPDHENTDAADSTEESMTKNSSQKTLEKSVWNPLNYIRASHESDGQHKAEERDTAAENLVQPITMKGRIILYTKLGCKDSKQARLFFRWRRLRYVEINIDVYPSRKLELEKISGSSAVPKVFFNEILIGGLDELKSLENSGKLDEKIDYLISEEPSFEAPLPPLSEEDDVSSSGVVDELALTVRKMRETIVVKDRFYKMRRFSSCFLGVEAVDFLSEDQYLEREEAVELGQQLASKQFFRHVLDENVFEDGNHLYRFLDDDPILSSQCHNIPRGITLLKPKPITEIASRLRFLLHAIVESYTSEDGKHVDYRSIHESEEFARYLRTVEELQRVELQDMSREEKLAFFINLYNMMAIHAILVMGYPVGPLERKKLFGDFKYVIGGCTYSLSAIQNGILRGNQRPPYNLLKPFNTKDKRLMVSLPFAEPLLHFALVSGQRSGPAIRCYSPGNIDKELMDAARDFLRSGGLIIDLNAKVASLNVILKWFSVDFGNNEVEVLKHASNYLEPTDAEALLELLANTQLKVIYQPYDWGINS